MDGAKRLALRREREARAPIFLQAAFRPFFLASASWFLAAMLLWLAILSGVLTLPMHLGLVDWHRHELIFGAVGAAMTGYLLTATPNWSGRLPAIGLPLAAMILWWGLARANNAIAVFASPWPAALIDAGFFLGLTTVIGREALHGKGRGAANVMMAGMFAIACGLDHLASAGEIAFHTAADKAGIAVLVVLVSLIGGRLIPSFTRNALPRADRSKVTAQGTRFDTLVNITTALACLLWVAGISGFGIAGLVLASLFQLMRAIRWRPWRIAHEPSVLALHLAYAWLPIGLLALAFAEQDRQSDMLHLLTAGAISSMVLAVMARMTMTQTGRVVRWRSATVFAVTLVSAGALVRVFAGSIFVSAQFGWLLAATLWMLGFVVFLMSFGPMLLRPRVRRGAA